MGEGFAKKDVTIGMKMAPNILSISLSTSYKFPCVQSKEV